MSTVNTLSTHWRDATCGANTDEMLALHMDPALVKYASTSLRPPPPPTIYLDPHNPGANETMREARKETREEVLTHNRHVRQAPRVLSLDAAHGLVDYHLRLCRAERVCLYGLCHGGTDPLEQGG